MTDDPSEVSPIPEHGSEEDQIVFTEEDDRTAPSLAVPDDEIVALSNDEGIDDLIAAANEADDG